MNSPPTKDTLNLFLHIKQFVLKKNRGLTEQLLHNKQWREHTQKGVGNRDTVMTGTPPTKHQAAVGRNVTEGPVH